MSSHYLHTNFASECPGPLAEQRGDFSLRPGALNVFRDLTGEQAAWDSRGL